MDCNKVKKVLSRYQDNELDSGQRSAVKLHLDTCSGCKREFSEMENIISDLIELESVPVPQNFGHKIMSQIYEKEEKKNSFLPFRYASILYSMIFLVFLYFGFIMIDIDKPEKNIQINNNADIYISALLASEEKLGLLDIQNSIMNLVEVEIANEN